MAYTVPLVNLPRLPAPQGKLVDASGLPTREFYSFFIALLEWARTIDAAVRENEP